MEKIPQRALKCLITQTGIDTHSHSHTHIRTRTPTHGYIRTHTPTYTHTHVEETHHNNTKTIHLPTVNKQYKPATPEPPQHQPYRHPQNFYLIPRPKPVTSNQSLYHSTKASVSYSLPPAHRTAPFLYAAACKPAQHRSCIGTLYQEQNNKNKQTQSVKISNITQVC